MKERGNLTENGLPDKNPQPEALRTYDGRVTREVVEALKQGDHEAYSIVYLTYREHILNFVSRFTGDPAAGEEITQEVFAYIWEKRDTLAPDPNIKTLLFLMARRRGINYLKSAGRLYNVALTDMNTGNLSTLHTAADRNVLETELQTLLKIHIESMPPQRRAVYELSLEGLSNEQIARRLDIDVKNVRQHKFNARKDLSVLRTLFWFFMLLS